MMLNEAQFTRIVIGFPLLKPAFLRSALLLSNGPVPHFDPMGPEAGCLDEIQTKLLRVFLIPHSSFLNSFALKCLFLQTHATSYSFHSAYTEKEKGEKPDGKHYPFSMV